MISISLNFRLVVSFAVLTLSSAYAAAKPAVSVPAQLDQNGVSAASPVLPISHAGDVAAASPILPVPHPPTGDVAAA